MANEIPVPQDLRPGREVLCRPNGLFFREFEVRGLPKELLTDGIDLTEKEIRSSRGRMDWENFRRFMANIGRVWDEDQLVEAGRKMTTSRWTQPFGAVSRLVISCRDNYRWMFGPKRQMSRYFFTCIVSDYEEIPPHRCMITTRMVPGYEPSPELFHVFKGSFARVPAFLGLPDAQVVTEEVPGGMRYTIDYPPSQPLLKRIHRTLFWPLHIRQAASQLRTATENLAEREMELATESSARLSALAALRESEEKFSKAFQATPAIMMIGRIDGTLLEVNSTFESLTGLSRDEVVNRDGGELNIWESQEVWDQVIEDLRRGEPARGIEVRYRTRSGETRSSLLSAEAITVGGEECMIWQGIDITQRKRAEEENLRLQEKILQTQKLESLGVMAGGIAHDFNNLLVGIQGNAEMALRNVDAETPTAESLRRIIDSSDRAAALTREMLAYAGKGKRKDTTFDLAALVKQTTTLVASGVSKEVEFHSTEEFEDALWVEGDDAQIQQVILNLLTNAAESYGDSGGRVEIRLDSVPSDPKLLEGAFVQNPLRATEYACLEVVDQGSGMDSSTLPRIFDPFYTTKFTGRGLGLASALGIVKNHGGLLRVESEPGRGSRFQVFVPRAFAPAPDAPPALETTVPGEGVVLAVDDDEDVLRVTQLMLEATGYRVHAATSGQEALEALQSGECHATAVVLDMSMPGLSGEETYARIREQFGEIPVLCYSGHGQAAGAEWKRNKIRVGFLSKPFSARELAEALQDLLLVEATLPSGR